VTESPLIAPVLFHFGPVPITQPVVTTWCLIAALTILCFAITRHLGLQPLRWQAVLEILVTTIEDQISQTMLTDGRPFVPLLGTLFIFLVFANLSSVLPGVRPPTHRSRPLPRSP
jgi:F-type H+-transporting ATPase subunit a